MMRARSSPANRVVFAASGFAVAFLAVGCAGTAVHSTNCVTAAAEIPAAPAGVAFELVVCALESTYAAEMVPVFVGIRNSSTRPQVVRSSFDVYGPINMRVIAPNGEEMQRASEWEPFDIASDAFQLARHLLPRDGVSGRVINLACDVTDLQDDGECARLYAFREAGTYMIELTTTAYWCAPPCIPDEQENVDERFVRFGTVRLPIEIAP